MRTAVFSFVKCGTNSIVASVRVARLISELIDAPLIDDEKIGDHTDLDVLIIVNGAFSFCKCLPELGRAVLGARRVVWSQQDYTIIPPQAVSGAESPFRKAFRDRRTQGKPDIDYWTTVQDNAAATPGSSYVNWNCLTFDQEMTDARVKQQRVSSEPVLFYYGSFRTGRAKYFDRYMLNPRVRTVVSSPAPKKFTERYPDVAVHGKIQGDFSYLLGTRGLGLYLEDKNSHSHFHSPANRFYEMLSAGLPMVFQSECGSMMRKAGYNPEPYFVNSAKGIADVMPAREDILAKQREEWLPMARQWRLDLPSKVQEAWKKTRELVS